jgi:hypothetical protein
MAKSKILRKLLIRGGKGRGRVVLKPKEGLGTIDNLGIYILDSLLAFALLFKPDVH